MAPTARLGEGITLGAVDAHIVSNLGSQASDNTYRRSIQSKSGWSGVYYRTRPLLQLEAREASECY